jgi:hypothetical protein
MAERQDQVAWIGRVLGVALAPAPGASPTTLAARWRAARAAWQAASDAADTQLSALNVALVARGDSDLRRIAEFGLGAVVGGQKVRLMAAIMEIGDGSDSATFAKAGRKLAALARAFLGHLAANERVTACDENPYGVRVALRATLTPALTGLLNVVETPAS